MSKQDRRLDAAIKVYKEALTRTSLPALPLSSVAAEKVEARSEVIKDEVLKDLSATIIDNIKAVYGDVDTVSKSDSVLKLWVKLARDLEALTELLNTFSKIIEIDLENSLVEHSSLRHPFKTAISVGLEGFEKESVDFVITAEGARQVLRDAIAMEQEPGFILARKPAIRFGAITLLKIQASGEPCRLNDIDPIGMQDAFDFLDQDPFSDSLDIVPELSPRISSFAISAEEYIESVTDDLLKSDNMERLKFLFDQLELSDFDVRSWPDEHKVTNWKMLKVQEAADRYDALLKK